MQTQQGGGHSLNHCDTTMMNSQDGGGCAGRRKKVSTSTPKENEVRAGGAQRRKRKTCNTARSHSGQETTTQTKKPVCPREQAKTPPAEDFSSDPRFPPPKGKKRRGCRCPYLSKLVIHTPQTTRDPQNPVRFIISLTRPPPPPQKEEKFGFRSAPNSDFVV